MNCSQKIFQQWQESNATIQKIFRVAASATPDELALVDGDTALTYLELDRITDDLAGYLQANGIAKDKIVWVYLEKCYEYIVACMAIRKAGGAYLHMDLDYSGEIMEKILKDTAPIAIISKPKHFDKLPECNAKKISMNEKINWSSFGRKLDNNFSMSASETAFIGYSSGTMGMPKGVRVSHKATVYSMSKFWQEIWHIQDINEFGYATYLSWDAMGPLMFGATGHIIPDTIDNDPLALVKYILKNKINHIFFTPSLLKTLLQEVPEEILKKSLTNLKVIWLGGEVTTGELIEQAYRILPDVYLVNNYGPSECFVVAPGQLTKSDVNFSLCPVGKVLPEMEILILDDKMQETPASLPGELYVTGPCLVDGYLNNPELTREKFIEIHGKNYYKTGDLAYILPDGRLVIQGRADFVVNIDNQKVNLLEIQYIIKKLLPIADCVVVGEEDSYNNQYLVCYFVKNHDANWEADPAEIKEVLSSVLPKKLIPRKYIELSKIPLSCTSQKVNYKQLQRS